MTVGVLLLAVVLVACGDNRSASRKAMDVKFQKIDERMAMLETTAAAYNQTYLAKATQQYLVLVREYANQLGPAEVKRRLLTKGDELAAYCVPCMATLEDEAKKY
jgi:hypothetical protein